MKILVINPILYSGNNGEIPRVKSIKDTMIYNMCIGFKKLGHQVTLLAMNDYKPIDQEKYDFEIIFFRSIFKCLLNDAIPLSFNMCGYIRKNEKQYDLVISSEIFQFGSLFTALICPEKTVIWQELTGHQKKLKKIPSKLWHNVVVPLFMSRLRVVIPRSLPAYNFIKKYKLHVVPGIVDHGINIDIFKCSKIKKHQFISVAQLIYRKNIDSIIKKFNSFLNESSYKDFKLILAGRGEMEFKLKELVHELDLDNKVFFLGFITHERLQQYISESYALLVNTRQDLNMVSIPESIVSGTPILTNSIPASAKYIDKEKLGIVKNNWDVNEMISIIENNKLYSDNCRLYRTNLSTIESAKRIIDIYENITNK